LASTLPEQGSNATMKYIASRRFRESANRNFDAGKSSIKAEDVLCARSDSLDTTFQKSLLLLSSCVLQKKYLRNPKAKRYLLKGICSIVLRGWLSPVDAGDA
jgi:hypothetical protein